MLLAAAQGEENALDSKKILRDKLTPYQIEEAQRLAREFVPRTETEDTDQKPSIEPFNHKNLASGTGFFITSDGYLVTAWHVIKDAETISVLTSQGVKSATMIQADKVNDIAILKAEITGASAFAVSASQQVKVGSAVFTVGFPNIGIQGFEPKFTGGTISSLSGLQDDPRHFQISAPVQPGNSGGPLIDQKGNVVGIVISRVNDLGMLIETGTLPQNVNYAIKSTFIAALLETLPQIRNNLTQPNESELKTEDIAERTRQAVALVLCQ